MSDRHYETERTMTKPSAGGTVTPTTTTGESSRAHRDSDDEDNSNDGGDDDVVAVASRASASRTESKSVQRKRRRAEPASPRTGIPRKTPRRTGDEEAASECPPDESATDDVPEEFQRDAREISSCSRDSSSSVTASGDVECAVTNGTKLAAAKRVDVDDDASEAEKSTSGGAFRESANNPTTETLLTRKPPMHPDAARRRLTFESSRVASTSRRDDSTRLRKTIQWLEEGARKLREDLAEARAELHEERRAARIARRDIEVAVREARAAETARHQRIIAELKTRLSQSPSRTTTELQPSSASAKAELLKDENHKRELSAAKKRLAEADATIRKLRAYSLDAATGGGGATSGNKRRRLEAATTAPSNSEIRKLSGEVKALRAANKKLEDKLNMVCAEAEKIRIMELRIQHENHESELSALKKSLRSDTIRMMDEIKSKDREIERLGRLARENRKSRPRDDEAMRKLRENENGHQIRLAPRIEDKIPQVENVIDLCKGECVAATELERLRELAIEQQEFIEVLRQAVKEKERKLDQLSNKRRKEEFYKQWLELEPVAEVDDEEEHEEGDSALSSAPSSLSPQPGGCGQWPTSGGVTREAYEAVLLEIDEIQTKYLEEQRELAHAKSQVRDLEKALLQETRGSQNSRRALSEKLRKIEERETALLAEISELRDQNELLEFRVLELEESPGSRETPDTADSGIVSPEPINIFKKEQNNKQRDRAIATVLPFTSYTHPASPVPIRKPPLSLQESGIFEADDDDDDIHDQDTDNLDDDDDDDEDDDDASNETEATTRLVVELTCRGTQTEAPVGELLQEVQRLHELRERIQERAVKVPSVDPRIGESADSRIDGDSEKSSSSSTSLREKIRELEETIARRDEADERRATSDLIAKQREEDLLDENYRLTERVYWLENELRRSTSATIDAETMTEDAFVAAFAAGGSKIDAETMTEAKEAKKNATIDTGTMTEAKETKKNATIDAETLTVETRKTIDTATMTETNVTIHVETMTEAASGSSIEAWTTAVPKNSSIVETMTAEAEKKRRKIGSSVDAESPIERWNKTLPEVPEATAKVTRMEVEVDVDGGDVVVVGCCAGCESLRRECDERVERMLASSCRGRLDDLARTMPRRGAEVVARSSRLEAEHARKLEDIGRRLEEKVECNRRIIAERVIAAAKMPRGQVDDDDDDQVDGMIYSRTRGDASSVISFADAAMEVDELEEDREAATTRTRQVDRTTTRTEADECPNCRAKRQKIIRDERVESSGRFSKVETHKNIVEAPTEIAVEATEETVEGSAATSATTTTTSEGGVSRVHLLPPDEERPAPEPAEETRRVNVSEVELDKKQVVYFRWR